MDSFIDKRVREYILPERIVKTSDNVKNAEVLLTNRNKINMFGNKNFCQVDGRGFIIFDFGKEYFGSLRLLLNRDFRESKSENIRVRFGESLSECCAEIGEKNASNDHSTRDITFYVSSNSDTVWGLTGYRYIRLDFIKDELYNINNVFGVFIHNERPKAKFVSDNKRLNDIFDVGSRTLFLNMQNGIWDGIKRDQHIWVGDLYPEILSIIYLYGDNEVLRDTLDSIISTYPLPCWYNDIPTYSVWFLLIICEYFEKTGNVNIFYKKSVFGILSQIDKCVDEFGDLDFSRINIKFWENYFFDWPSFQTKDSKYASSLLLLYALRKIINSDYFDARTTELSQSIFDRLNKIKPLKSSFKAITSFSILNDKGNKKEQLEFVLKGNAKGYSTFLSYFISKALADNGKTNEAIDNILSYYGGMIEKGATTFWEGFDIDWMDNTCSINEFPKKGQKDIHGDFGKDCYVGYRHSLCHGWSCGVIAFIVEYIVGLKIYDGGKRISVKPNLSFCSSFYCEIPINGCFIKINCKKVNGKEILDVDLPNNVQLIK